MCFISVFSYHTRDNLPIRARQKLFPFVAIIKISNVDVSIKLDFLNFRDFVCQIFEHLVPERCLIGALCVKCENTNLIDFR